MDIPQGHVSQHGHQLIVGQFRQLRQQPVSDAVEHRVHETVVFARDVHAGHGEIAARLIRRPRRARRPGDQPVELAVRDDRPVAAVAGVDDGLVVRGVVDHHVVRVVILVVQIRERVRLERGRAQEPQRPDRSAGCVEHVAARPGERTSDAGDPANRAMHVSVRAVEQNTGNVGFPRCDMYRDQTVVKSTCFQKENRE